MGGIDIKDVTKLLPSLREEKSGYLGVLISFADQAGTFNGSFYELLS